MKTKSLSVFLILILLMGGCSNVVHDNSEKKVTLHEVSSSVVVHDKNNKATRDGDYSWKKSVAKKLLSEFNMYYKKMKKDDKIYYNRIMAADRATGLLSTYKDYISNKSLKDIKDKQDEINAKLTGFSTVSFGYTNSGLHIIALMDMHNSTSMPYEPVCNFIRGYKQEIKLLEDMYFDNDCYLSDIFIEDLSNKKEKFDIHVDSILIDGPNFKLMKEIESFSNESKETLKKYNRIIESKDGRYVNKTWRLIATEALSDFLRVHVDDEQIDLVTKASDSCSIKLN